MDGLFSVGCCRDDDGVDDEAWRDRDDDRMEEVLGWVSFSPAQYLMTVSARMVTLWVISFDMERGLVVSSLLLLGGFDAAGAAAEVAEEVEGEEDAAAAAAACVVEEEEKRLRRKLVGDSIENRVLPPLLSFEVAVILVAVVEVVVDVEKVQFLLTISLMLTILLKNGSRRDDDDDDDDACCRELIVVGSFGFTKYSEDLLTGEATTPNLELELVSFRLLIDASAFLGNL